MIHGFDTELVHFDPAPGDPFHPSATPIYQTATFRQQSAGNSGNYDYTRSGNPTRHVFQNQIARLERGTSASAFSSGMAAINAVTSLVNSGDGIVAGDDLYGGTCRLLSRVLTRQGIDVRYIDTTDLDSVALEMKKRPGLVLIETPTNPFLKVTDISALASLVHENGGILAVDNTILSPYLQNPLEQGADVVIHSATKYLCGHSDVTAGAVVTVDERLGEKIAFYQNAAGTGLAPFEAWLLIRGMKTLGLRLERQQSTAARLARFLTEHHKVEKVYHPDLPNHPGRDLHFRQARGAGGVISFETESAEFSKKLIAATKLFAATVSFGGVASSISLPFYMSHANIPPAVRADRMIPKNLVRVSVGIENPDDLLEDLTQALETADNDKDDADAAETCTRS